MTIAAGGLSVTAGGVTVGGIVNALDGLSVSAGGLVVLTGGATIGGAVTASSGLMITAGGLSVNEGEVTVGDTLMVSNGITIANGGLFVVAGGATIASYGTNLLSTSATDSSAITALATLSSGYVGSVLNVSTKMVGSGAFFFIKVCLYVHVNQVMLACLFMFL